MVNAALESIGEALDEIDPQRSFVRIKGILARLLKEVNPEIRVKVTTYFNHTHVPDMVVSWPLDPDLGDRYLYLRTTTDIDDLFHDMQFLAPEDRPIVLSLGDFTPSNDARTLHHSSMERHALVLDLAALSVLTAHTGEHSAGRLASRAIIEGGQGLLDERDAEELSSRVTSGVRGARIGDRTTTDAAIESASSSLFPVAAQRLTAFLTSLWQGTGLPATALENAPRRGFDLDASSLTYLLEGDEIEDAEFWDRMVRRIALPQVLQSRIPDTPNFQHLMDQAMDVWRARACAVMHGPSAIARSGDHPWRWTVDSGLLKLHARDFRVHVAQKRAALNVRETYSLPPYELVIERIRTLDMRVSGITLINGSEKATYQGKGRDVLADSQLYHLSEALGPGSVVKEIEARIGLSAIVKYSFESRAANAKSPRVDVPLRELIDTSIRLFADFSNESYRHNDLDPPIGDLDGIEVRFRGELPEAPEGEG